MQEFHSLRPEDFQKAWPAAYAQAVEQVVALKEQAAYQLTSATEQVWLAQSTTSRTIRMLNECTKNILDDIRSAHADAQKQMHTSCDALAAGVANLIQREKAFQQTLLREKLKIDQARAEVVMSKDVFRKSPIWKRVWWALNPSIGWQVAGPEPIDTKEHRR
jgi:hypothetical protein